MKHTVKIEPLGISCTVHPDTPLRDILTQYGMEFPCAGQGICGNCRIELLQGNIALTEAHRKALQTKRINNLSTRLACLCRVTEDITVRISQFSHIILADHSDFSFTPDQGYGIAVDLGSTTLVSQLLNLENGKIEGVETALNPQTAYGADLISRISFAMESQENALLLTSIIRETLGKQIENLYRSRPCGLHKIRIVGNTVMHHLFCGLDLSPLAVYPFFSPHSGEYRFTPQDLNWQIPSSTEICFLPNIGGFVGSDILAGIRATRMYEKEKYQLLIDLGTNGEIAIGNRQRILCASTAAGPAFEGSNITQGIRATEGAIVGVKQSNGRIEAQILGNGKAKGICGSGLIDAIEVFLESGEIDVTGNFTTEKPRLHLTNDIYLYPQDIREFQLAKAAIAAGIQLLLNRLNITHHDIEQVFIAGGFGHYIHLAHAIRLGLLEFEETRIVRLSNSALTGAKIALFETDDCFHDILRLTEPLSLETLPDFQDIFCEKMFFYSPAE